MIPRCNLIVNADDYGLTASVNEAIINLIRAGAVTSTTVMANYVTQEYARKLISIVRNKKISVGMHINLVEGKPVSEKENVSSIVNNKGYFYSPGMLLLRGIFGLIDKNQLKFEIKSQYSKLIELGLNIEHVDSHMHVHTFPCFSRIISSTLKDLDISRVRNASPSLVGNFRMLVLFLFNLMANGWYKTFVRPNKLVTIFSKKNIDSKILVNHILKINKRDLEIMVHPSLIEVGGVYDRFHEYEILSSKSFKEEIEKYGFKLTSFSDLDS